VREPEVGEIEVSVRDPTMNVTLLEVLSGACDATFMFPLKP